MKKDEHISKLLSGRYSIRMLKHFLSEFDDAFNDILEFFYEIIEVSPYVYSVFKTSKGKKNFFLETLTDLFHEFFNLLPPKIDLSAPKNSKLFYIFNKKTIYKRLVTLWVYDSIVDSFDWLWFEFTDKIEDNSGAQYHFYSFFTEESLKNVLNLFLYHVPLPINIKANCDLVQDILNFITDSYYLLISLLSEMYNTYVSLSPNYYSVFYALQEPLTTVYIYLLLLNMAFWLIVSSDTKYDILQLVENLFSALYNSGMSYQFFNIFPTDKQTLDKDTVFIECSGVTCFPLNLESFSNLILSNYLYKHKNHVSSLLKKLKALDVDRISFTFLKKDYCTTLPSVTSILFEYFFGLPMPLQTEPTQYAKNQYFGLDSTWSFIPSTSSLKLDLSSHHSLSLKNFLSLCCHQSLTNYGLIFKKDDKFLGSYDTMKLFLLYFFAKDLEVKRVYMAPNRPLYFETKHGFLALLDVETFDDSKAPFNVISPSKIQRNYEWTDAKIRFTETFSIPPNISTLLDLSYSDFFDKFVPSFTQDQISVLLKDLIKKIPFYS
ncbi:MAG: hypothetical protein ACTSYD_09175 [Candidatus Heimdallarchaeaceae archaeon]